MNEQGVGGMDCHRGMKGKLHFEGLPNWRQLWRFDKQLRCADLMPVRAWAGAEQEAEAEQQRQLDGLWAWLAAQAMAFAIESSAIDWRTVGRTVGRSSWLDQWNANKHGTLIIEFIP